MPVVKMFVALAAVVRPRLCGAVGAVILDRTLLLTPEGGEPGLVEQWHGRILSDERSRCRKSRSRRLRAPPGSTYRRWWWGSLDGYLLDHGSGIEELLLLPMIDLADV